MRVARAFASESVAELAAAVAAGRVLAADLTERCQARLRRVDPGEDGIAAFLSSDFADAAAAAERIDRSIAAGNSLSGSLTGIPVAVKDNICTLDLPTTCGSLMLEGYRSPYEATAVRRLREAGAVLVGKTNLDEFAMGSSTENSAFGPTRNPNDLGHVPGGSSGGSAAAVAAGIVPAALGSDTGGSVRQPAAYCGVVGIKPTYGRVSRYGLVAFASSFDQIGTFGRTVADAALLLRVIEGPDPFDATTTVGETGAAKVGGRVRRADVAGAARPADVRPAETAPADVELVRPPTREAAGPHDLEGTVVGVGREYFPDDLSPGLASACRAALEELREAGAEIREVSLPHTPIAIAAYYLIAPAEVSSNLARFDGMRYGYRADAATTLSDLYEDTRSRGFGEEAKRRILLGTFALSAQHRSRYHDRARRARGLVAGDFRAAFESGVDVLFTPTAPGPAFPLGERSSDPRRMYLTDAFTVPASLAGLPALSMPVGRVDGLPLGAQLIADRWREATMIRVATALERRLAEGGVWNSSR